MGGIKKVGILFLFALIFSCFSNEKNEDYSSPISKKVEVEKLIKRINLSKENIKKAQDKEKLFLEDTDLLEYHYELSATDFYDITYLFDEKGCFEIGCTIEFKKSEDAQRAIEYYKKYCTNLKSLTHFEAANLLYRWNNKAKNLTVELDVALATTGKFSITIFANE